MNLSISRILSEAFVELRENSRTLIVALAPPAIGIAMLAVWHAQQPEQQLSVLGFVLLLPQMFLYALFAVTCHRVILLGRERLPNALGVYASKEVWQYTGAMVAFTFISIVALMLLAVFLGPIMMVLGPETGRVVTWGLMIAMGLLAIAVASRVILLFPAMAIGAGQTLNDILDLSKPNWPRLAVLILASMVLTGLISWPLTWLTEVSGTPLAAVIPAFLNTLVGAYGVAVISCAYRAHMTQAEPVGDDVLEPS